MIHTGRKRRASRIGLALALTTIVVCAFAETAAAQDLQVTTDPSLYPAFDSAVSDYVVRCTPGTPVQVTISAPAGTDVDVDGHGGASGDFSTAVGLESGQAFFISATSAAGNDLYYVRCLPSDFPSWTYERLGQPEAEWYLVDTLSGQRYGMAFDRNGVPVWWLKPGGPALDFRLLPNGDVIFARTGLAGDEEYRLDGTLVRVVQAVAPSTDPHEVQLLPNGDYLVAAQQSVPNQTACGQSGLTVSEHGVQEVRPDGSLVWSWWPLDQIPLTEIPTAWCSTALAGAPEDPKDVYHINAIEPTADGFMVSYRHLDAIYAIDQADGSVSWKIGGVHRPESLTVLDDPLSSGGGDTFRGQHDVRLLDDGTVTVHDNGFHPGDTRPPRAVRFAIDTAAGTATLVEQKDDPGPIGTPLCCGSARKLPGGNWVINWGSSNLMTELDPLGARISSLSLTGSFSYRAQPLLPGTVSRDAFREAMMLQYPRGYPRPKWASILKTPLVPAYDECMSPNATHADPLVFGSCSPPSSGSFLTVGTPDANGTKANSVGYVKYQVRTGNPATPRTRPTCVSM